MEVAATAALLMLSDSGVSFRRLGDIANPWRVRQGSTHVPKLSILIAAHDEALLESSLVSVLQNRPPDCEIIVVNDEGYHDPYALAGEVRFVRTPADTSELDRLNRGVRCLSVSAGAHTAPAGPK